MSNVSQVTMNSPVCRFDRTHTCDFNERQQNLEVVIKAEHKRHRLTSLRREGHGVQTVQDAKYFSIIHTLV